MAQVTRKPLTIPLFLPLVFIVLFIAIRTVHFSDFLNFSFDQATFSLKALQIWKDKEVTLIGPTFSMNYQGRYAFQGGAIYYFHLLFLILGQFDPLKASYAFMLWCALMIMPLYLGLKKLINTQAAIFGMTLYTLLPYYIDYTRFLWNPNTQLSLLPLLILAMGVFKQKPNLFHFGVIGFLSGLLLQFHYQFVLIMFGLLVYYFILQKNIWRYFVVWLLSFSIGFSNMLLFELRNQFYNTKTILLFFSSIGKSETIGHFDLVPHYFLSVSFMIFIVFMYIFRKKMSWKVNTFLFTALFIWSALTYFPKPSSAFGIPNQWQYEDDIKVYNIISESKISKYNIVNLAYDTLATTQKYLHAKNDKQFDFGNYSSNEYLFVVSADDQYLQNSAYEVNSFIPSELIQSWPINEKYSLYLLKRSPKS